MIGDGVQRSEHSTMVYSGHETKHVHGVHLGCCRIQIGCVFYNLQRSVTSNWHARGLLPWFTARDERYRMTWQSYRSKKWHCIDHILIPSKWLRVVRKVRACPFADGLTDHRMVKVCISLCLRRSPCEMQE